MLSNPPGDIFRTGSYADTLMNGYENNLSVTSNPYWVTNYLQYPSPYYTIENTLVDNETRLLFIMDSVSMRTISFVALGVKHITVIDPRQENAKQYLQDVLQENAYDSVIIAGGGKDFYNAI
jgi:hypothetical protein